MKVNLKTKKKENETENETDTFGPLRWAPDPTDKYFEPSSDNRAPADPQRHWEPEFVQTSYPNSTVNNYHYHQNGRKGFNSQSVRPKRFVKENVRSNSNYADTRDSYQPPSVDEEHEDSVDQSSDDESGFEFPTSYKKKLKRLQKLEEDNVKELASMKRKIATIFL